ncbi:glutamate-5-semialdehyde dehydrogenase [Alkaliphilus peptidifermentans]|uniref:Gamma-glutamyl phosphate reductase n=1 Tax=Alkaliphilus peptidifermentans DSM 18978 TaxID=1120976 RepID=A0A1G5KJ78_9FIRM|nr:glutamate-5-semialdehyde dehydrogenase [Alkaliphilus peptidifermentans]SCZ00685.1 glutamate-5-semialdehyde dehydrogenase [Alkaliphilus peptidifermentans DSM 18978]
MSQIIEMSKKLKHASYGLSEASSKDKNEALREVALSLDRNRSHILSQNSNDIKAAEEIGMKESLIDRLMLNDERIDGMIKGILQIVELEDPIWRSNKVWTLENGLIINRMTVPLGVIGIIYESRPNVTVDAFSLAFKSSNCVILRGSSSALNSNIALVKAIKEGLKRSNISEDVIFLIDDADRKLVKEMLTLNEYIDVIIPRGGNDLIRFVIDNATIPTIETGVGNCHIYVDNTGKFDMALKIIENAKVQRPGVCNACESILIHKDIASDFLPLLHKLIGDRVELRGCAETLELIDIMEANEADWFEEYLDYKLAVKIVNNIEEAISHINKYGTKHSEAIITENYSNANLFLRRIDAAAVYVNASTRFTDGSEFGFGGEIGISTQKIHARGPMGLNELVTTKYTILGNGQYRE